MLPAEKMKRGRVGVNCINSVEMFCYCRMPIEGKMIECGRMQGVLPLGLCDELKDVWYCT